MLVAGLVQEPHYCEIKLHLIEQVLSSQKAGEAQQTLQNLSQIIDDVKRPGNTINFWTANTEAVPIMMLIIDIATKIGRKFPQHRFQQLKVVEDIVSLVQSFV